MRLRQSAAAPLFEQKLAHGHLDRHPEGTAAGRRRRRCHERAIRGDVSDNLTLHRRDI